MLVESPDLTELGLLKKQNKTHSCHSELQACAMGLHCHPVIRNPLFFFGFGTFENDTLILMLYKLQQALKRGVKSRFCSTTDLNFNPGLVTCCLSWTLFLPPILWSTTQNFFLFPSISQILSHFQLADMFFNVFAWNTLSVPSAELIPLVLWVSA